MDNMEFFSRLKSMCADAIDAYRTTYPDALPLSDLLVYDPAGPIASEAAVHARFEELIAFYDDLVDVDSTPYRDSWRDHLVYDVSRRERLALLQSDLPGSVTFLWIQAEYVASTGHICVSGGRLPTMVAYSYLCSGVCYAYQHRFDSPTWAHPYLRGGYEGATSILALKHLARELDDESLAHIATRQRTIALLEGVLAHGTRQGGIMEATVRELDVNDTELSTLRAGFPARLLGRIRPRYRWSSLAFLPEHALFASLLLVSDAAGVSGPYLRAFHGEHPWRAVIDDIRSTPS